MALTSGAREAFSGGQVDLALALAMQAVSVEQPPAQAVRTLNDVAYAPGTSLIYQSENPDSIMYAVDMLPDAPYLLAQDGGTITVWDSNNQEILNQFDTGNEDTILGWLISIPNSTTIANAYNNGEVIIWDWLTGEKVQTLPDIDMAYTGNLFAPPSGNTIVSMLYKGESETEVDGLPTGFSMIGWDIESGDQIYRIDGARGERSTWNMATPDGGTALIATTIMDEAGNYTADSRLLIIDLETGTILSESALEQFVGNNYIESIDINSTGDQAFALITELSDDIATTGVFFSLPAAEVITTVTFDIDVDHAKYSPDGSQVAVYIDNQSQKYFTLLDTVTGESIRQLGSRTNGHVGYVNWGSLTFTPDGKRLVSGDGRGVVMVWDVETGELIQRLAGHDERAIYAVKVSPDGNTAVSAGGSSLRFWDISEDTAARVFEGHDAEINYAIAISPDGEKAISTAFSFSGGVYEAILWDTSTFEIIHRLPGWFLSAAFLPDGQTAIIGGEDVDANSEILLLQWDIESGEVLNRSERTDIGAAWEIALSPDGNSFFFVTQGTEMFQIDIETLTEMKSFSTFTDDEGLLSVTIHPDGQRALVGGGLGDIVMFDLDTGEVIQRYNNQGGAVYDIYISADGKRFVSGWTDGTSILWDIASGEVIQSFSGHTNVVTGVAFTADESQLVTSSGDGTLILWDVASGEALRTFSEHDAWVNRVALSPDGKLAYSTADDGTVIVRPITEIPVDEILAYIADNRVLYEFTCVERKQYRVFPLCDANGVVPNSGN